MTPVRGQKPAQLIVVDQGLNGVAQAAVELARATVEGDWEKLETLLDGGFTYSGDGLHFNKQEYIGFMQDMRAAFSDFEMKLEKIITEGNFTSIRFTSGSVNTGSFMGSPANSKDLAVSGIFHCRVEGGKVMQEWQTIDLLGTLNRIGLGAMLGYTVFVTGFGMKQPPPVRKPNDFLHVDGKVENFDRMTPQDKNAYVKAYLKGWKG